MKIESLRGHLRAYSIRRERGTTLNHAFASAIAPTEEFDRERAVKAMTFLGQEDPDDLRCVYCGAEAQTWDHVASLVQKTRTSGFGHTLGNLVPACKDCNSRRGNRNWRDWARMKAIDSSRVASIATYIAAYSPPRLTRDEVERRCPELARDYESARESILRSMAEADEIAHQIRSELRKDPASGSRRPRIRDLQG